MFNSKSYPTSVTLRAMCAAGAILFLIAITIILSLIPLYLPKHDSSLTYLQDQTQVFYLVYSTTVNNETIDYSQFTSDLTGATQQLNKQLGLSANKIVAENLQIIQKSDSTSGRRKKRALDFRMLLTCQGYYPRTCRSQSCREEFLPNIQKQCSNYSNIGLQLRSSSNVNQMIQFDLTFLDFALTAPSFFTKTNTTSNGTTLTNLQLIQNCLSQDLTKQPVIIDTDTDIDDLWAIFYLINVPTIDILAITTVGDGFSAAFYSTSNVLSFLELVGCTDGIGVASGLKVPYLSTGWTVSDSILSGIDTYMTSGTCLNQSTDIFLQPSPFEAVELIVYSLKYSQKPVDILALGPLTNIAAAIIRDRSIVSKIGTLYLSGGQFRSYADYPTLIPNPSIAKYPYSSKTSGSSSNIFLDVLAAQRIDDSGIKKYVAMPTTLQNLLKANLTQLNETIQKLNLNLTPFSYKFISSLARCTNQSESSINWWDNSAAQLMIQMQNNLTNGFCTNFTDVQSLYILSADADQLFGQGLIDFQKSRPNTKGLSNYTICTQFNSNVFLTEFLTKIASNKLYSCENIYEDRFDQKLQSCLNTYGYD